MKRNEILLGFILVLVSYYSVFNLVASRLSRQLSDFQFYGIQIFIYKTKLGECLYCLRSTLEDGRSVPLVYLITLLSFPSIDVLWVKI